MKPCSSARGVGAIQRMDPSQYLLVLEVVDIDDGEGAGHVTGGDVALHVPEPDEVVRFRRPITKLCLHSAVVSTDKLGGGTPACEPSDSSGGRKARLGPFGLFESRDRKVRRHDGPP